MTWDPPWAYTVEAVVTGGPSSGAWFSLFQQKREARIGSIVDVHAGRGSMLQPARQGRSWEGQVLLHLRPGPAPALVRQFDAGLDPLWRWSALREESGVRYLHLDETPAGEECEHDLALDLVRYRTPRGRLTLWYRTADPAARVEIVVEVDAKDRLKRFALIDSSLRSGSEQPPRPVQFRAVAPAVSQFQRLRVVGGSKPMIADGQWRTLGMDLEAACAADGRYEFRRALFARLLGSMDVKRLRLADRGPPKGQGKVRRASRSRATDAQSAGSRRSAVRR
jgi:hypothetical protein